MALSFNETEVVSSQYKQLKLNELNIGESVHFFVMDTEQRSSEEFGDFQTVVGLELDVSKANTMDELVDVAEVANFIPNTMLQNAKLQNNCFYRIEKAWNRGDKSPSGKKAKGFGFKIFKLNLDASTVSALAKKFNSEKFNEQEITPPNL